MTGQFQVGYAKEPVQGSGSGSGLCSGTTSCELITPRRRLNPRQQRIIGSELDDIAMGFGSTIKSFNNIGHHPVQSEQTTYPEHRVVLSVKKLHIFGRRIMLDAVLETMLGRVFRFMKECLTEGYSLGTLVKVAQSMSVIWKLCIPSALSILLL
ncbi:hypothetical protein BG000_006694 [Podila horticola]|nr:hypothetical protein BG000_006694 [Podila horticola]